MNGIGKIPIVKLVSIGRLFRVAPLKVWEILNALNEPFRVLCAFNRATKCDGLNLIVLKIDGDFVATGEVCTFRLPVVKGIVETSRLLKDIGTFNFGAVIESNHHIVARNLIEFLA